MTTVSHSPGLDTIQFQPASMICCFQFSEKRPLKGLAGLIDWRLLGRLSALRISNDFSGRRNESLLVLPGNRLPASYFVLLGAGDASQFTRDTFCELLDAMFDCARNLKTRHIAVSLPGRDQNLVSGEEAIPWFFEHSASMTPTPFQFPFVIIDNYEMQTVVAAEVDRYRMRQVIPETIMEN